MKRKTTSYPRWRKHGLSQFYYFHSRLWLYSVYTLLGPQKTFSARAPDRYGGNLGEFATLELAKIACEQNYAREQRQKEGSYENHLLD